MPATNFAFITYSRKNAEQAKQLQADLEWYRIPTDIPKPQGVAGQSGYIRPVVRDKTDLDFRPESFWNDIEAKLSDSHYLIVMCSTSAAASVNVDREIRHFLSSFPDAASRIVPVIVDGEPRSVDPARECFPPALLELPDTIAVRNLPTYVGASREEVLLQTVAFLLDVRYATVNDRYQAAKRKRLRRTVVGVAMLAALFAAIAIVAMFQWNYARQQERAATAAKVEATRRLAESQVAIGDVQQSSQSFLEARKSYFEALSSFDASNSDSLLAEIGLALNFQAAPKAMLSINGPSTPVSLAVSQDARRIVSFDLDGCLRLWDSQTGVLLRTIEAAPPPATGTISPAEARDVVGTYTKLINKGAMDVRNLLLYDATRPIRHVRFLGDGARAVTLAETGLCVWDLKEGRKLHSVVDADAFPGFGVSDDATLALIATRDRGVRMLQLPECNDLGEIKLTLKKDEMLMSLALSGDGRTAALGTSEQFKTFDVKTQTTRFSLPVYPMVGCELTRDGSKAVVARFGFTIALMDFRIPSKSRELCKSEIKSPRVAIDRAGTTAVAHIKGDVLRVWDIPSGKQIADLPGNTVAFSPDGSLIVTQLNGAIKVWDRRDATREVRRLVGHTSYVEDIALSADGKLALSASMDDTLRLWDVESGHQLRSLDIKDLVPARVFFHPRKPAAAILVHLGAKGEKPGFVIFDMESGARTNGFPLPYPYSAALSPDGSTLLCATRTDLKGEKEKVEWAFEGFDVETGERLYKHAVPRADCVAFTPDGRRALGGGILGALCTFDPRTGGNRVDFTAPNQIAADSIAVTSDSKWAIASTISPRIVLIWDLVSGKLVRAIARDEDAPRNVAACGPAGSPVIIAGQQVGLWDPTNSKQLRVFDEISGESRDLCTTADGRLLLASDENHALIVYDFARSRQYMEFIANVESAQQTLAKSPDDPRALRMLGEWFAFLRRDDWALDLLDRCRAAGAPTNPLIEARARWNLSRLQAQPSGRSREELAAAATRDFTSALAQCDSDMSRFRLRLYRDHAANPLAVSVLQPPANTQPSETLIRGDRELYELRIPGDWIESKDIGDPLVDRMFLQGDDAIVVRVMPDTFLAETDAMLLSEFDAMIQSRSREGGLLRLHDIQPSTLREVGGMKWLHSTGRMTIGTGQELSIDMWCLRRDRRLYELMYAHLPKPDSEDSWERLIQPAVASFRPAPPQGDPSPYRGVSAPYFMLVGREWVEIGVPAAAADRAFMRSLVESFVIQVGTLPANIGKDFIADNMAGFADSPAFAASWETIRFVSSRKETLGGLEWDVGVFQGKLPQTEGEFVCELWVIARDERIYQFVHTRPISSDTNADTSFRKIIESLRMTE